MSIKKLIKKVVVRMGIFSTKVRNPNNLEKGKGLKNTAWKYAKKNDSVWPS